MLPTWLVMLLFNSIYFTLARLLEQKVVEERSRFVRFLATVW